MENLLSQLEMSDDDSSGNLDSPPTPQSTLSVVRDQIGDWDSWRKKTLRKELTPLRKLIGKNALFWGMPTTSVIHQPVIAGLLTLKRRTSKSAPEFDYAEAAASWIRGIVESVTIANAIEAIAWAHSLPLLTHRLEEQTWSDLLAHLVWLAEANGPANNESEEETSSVTEFITSVELRLSLAYSTSALPLCKSQRKEAKEAFATMMDRLLDGEGTPHARNIADLQYLLASCTRCLMIDAESKKGRISKSAKLQYEWLVRQTLKWSAADASPILSRNLDSPHFDEMLKFALKLTNDESDISTFKALRGKRTGGAKDLQETSTHSEWSELATMRTSWSPKAIRLAVNYSNREIDVELSSGNEAILRGTSNPRLVVNDELLSIDSDWEEICWETDKDLDYLELECNYTRGWRVQRQILLAREDKFLLVADAIMGPAKSQIQYQHTLPTTDNITVEQEPENTEAAILGDRKIGRILPLALSEWRSEQRHDRLRQEPVRLEMKNSAIAMYAPLFIDLEPSRRNKSVTWRQLTVAENLLQTPSEIAVAYRVQVGEAQWVIYRTLGETGNRTFLGQNVISDFYVARFMRNGETQMLLDVQPSSPSD